MPPIDLILISHNHYDHLDIDTLQRLYNKHHPKVLTGLGNSSLLLLKGIGGVCELDWWEKETLFKGTSKECSITFTPPQHFSARTLFDRNRTLWGGFVIERKKDFLYFAGDTAYCNVFKEIRERFGSARVAFLPIGAYKPRWFMEVVHMCPEESLKAHIELRALKSVAMHFGCFHLSDEGIDEPTNLLKEKIADCNLSKDSFAILAMGERLRNI